MKDLLGKVFFANRPAQSVSAKLRFDWGKRFFADSPAEDAFAGTTLLLVSLWLGPSLFLLCGGLENCNSPIQWVRFWQLVFILPVPFCALYALTSWFHFYLREFSGKKKTALVLIILALAVVMYLFCSDVNSPAGPAALTLFFILLPLLLIPRVWKIIIPRCACLLGACWLVWDGISWDPRFQLQFWFCGCLVLLLAGYLFSGLMYARAAQIPFRQLFGRGVKILWGCVAAVWLISLGMVFVNRIRADHAVKDLEKHFARPFSVQALKTFYTNGRKIDAAFWDKLEKKEDSTSKEWIKFENGQISGSPEGVYPPELLKEFDALMERTGTFRELEKMFDRPLPARDIEYQTGALAGVELPELNLMRQFCRWELWRIRFAVGKNDLPGALNALKRMKNASDYLVDKPSSLLAALVMIGCEDYRMRGMELLLAEGNVPETVLKEWQDELDRDDRKIPQIHFDTLYPEAAMAQDACQAVIYGDGGVYENSQAPIFLVRWLFPPMWYCSALCHYEAIRRFQVRRFGEMPKIELHLLGSLSGNDFPVNVQRKFDQLSALYRTMRALIGIELEKRRTGKYPDTVADLPPDPFTGKPMRYRKGAIPVTEPVWDAAKKRFEENKVRAAEGIAVW
ncbi:MAG: hypothetical protein IJS14_12870, partial [Lentisphaeria bacterium]|nr:hypothetical protein [Lentisphaeria bacterium]